MHNRPTSRWLDAILVLSSLLLAAGATAQQWQWVVDRALPGEFQGQLAYDDARERVVLFGCVDLIGTYNTPRSFTYEWDGERWMHRHTETVQVRNTALCYDEVRRRVVRTFGTYDHALSATTWEWDGYSWTLRTASGVVPRSSHAATFHGETRELLVFGGAGQVVPFLGDTLRLSGTSWAQGTPSVSPPMRHGHGMTYDVMRQRSVLFGGRSPGTFRNDTWEWDGLAWQARLPTNLPPAREQLALAHDPRRARTVLFGGISALGEHNDTWEWGGMDWQQIVTAHAPAPRAGAAMVFDRVAGHMLLFGGHSGCCRRHSDTWCYDGNDWRQLRGDAGPSRRVGPALVHDFFRGRTVVFGGTLQDNVTWETDGRTWQGVLTNPSPSVRYNHHATFDLWRRKMVLFGGQDGSSNLLGDTWEWDGTAWTQRVTSPAPAPRWGGCMAFDAGRCVTVLFGGQNFQGVLGETWEWSGIAWQQRATVHVPQWTSFEMTYDPGIGRIVMFGGSDQQGPRADTWHYDGFDWTLVAMTGPTAPPPRAYPSLTYHVGRGRTVMFGGGVWGAYRNDLWEWDGSQWTEWLVAQRPEPQTATSLAYDFANARLILTGGYFGQHLADTWLLTPGSATATGYGSGCAAATSPRLRGDDPFLGNEGCTVELIDARPIAPALLLGSARAANVPLPGGCTLLVEAPLVAAVGLTSTFGGARFPVPVPLNPGLRGATVFLQAIVLDGQTQFAGTAWTAGLRLTAGE